MSIIVEHEKRRRNILKRALDVFVDEGFEDATFQKIADRCGITRTTLYIYFKNKKEIFNYSIKQLLSTVDAELAGVRSDTNLNTADKLVQVLSRIIELLEKNRRLLSVILDYLLHVARSGGDPNYRIRRRTLKLRHILATMVIDGIKAGEIVSINVKTADDLLYPLIESAIFRLTVLKQESVGDLKTSAALAVRLMTRP
ncbi:MAG: TetR/AcrR family transcriptional regulator [Treponema sp.]|jgi:AcrR family transcriptional regulator|nr:TetR/AcrR family transcriptional regulator [Treponema sp.]